jgi:translation initiation factor 1
MSKKNDWKKREGIVYSTSEDFGYQYDSEGEADTLPAGKQQLRVQLDQHNRGGKQVTLVTGFHGKAGDLAELTRMLKSKCGVGGSSKDGQILIQGDLREKVKTILRNAGYKVK